MKYLEFNKKNDFKKMFFTIKTLALFFCVIPIFKYFIANFTGPFSWLELATNLIICLALMMVLAFVWIFMDKYHNNKYMIILEIVVFFIICATSIYMSGFFSSYYKFVFIFMIVIYTIEADVKYGYTIAFCASMFVLATDLIYYSGGKTNPYFENDLTLCAMFVVIAWILGYYVKIAHSHINELSEYANIDGLTGVYNHRYFYQELDKFCAAAEEGKKPLSLLMMDMDYFKLYNDLYGHQQGDEALKKLSEILKEFLDENAIICRYGGDEFAIILPDTDIDRAQEMASGLKDFISDHEILGQDRLPNGLFTVSIGLSQYKNGEEENINDLVNRADIALYRAKYLRRNDVEVYSSFLEEFSVLDVNNKDTQQTLDSLKAFLNIINSRDSYTYNHTDRVVMLCNEIAEYMQLSDMDKKRLCFGAYLHDIGKINIPKEVLIKQEKLTDEEWEKIRLHPKESAAIIDKIEGVEDIVPIVLQHHERYDGKGYPSGLKGEEIEYLARLLTLADSFDAMTNARPYQRKKSYTEAFIEIETCSGSQFDPNLSKIFIEAVKAKCGSNAVDILK